MRISDWSSDVCSSDLQPIAIFPEGTTGDGATLLPFKPSLLAVMTPPPRDMLVQPVYIDYGDAARDIAWCNGESAGVNAGRLLVGIGQLAAALRFLAPSDPNGFPHRTIGRAHVCTPVPNAHLYCR